MSYKGQVKQGKIELDDSVELPEGAIVKVELVESDELEGLHPDIVRFTGIVPSSVDASGEYKKALESKHG